MKSQNKRIEYIQVHITFYRKMFPKKKYYPTYEDDVNSDSFRGNDGLWFGIDLGGDIPINVHKYFYERRWNANCEYCELDKDGEWNHYFDSNIYFENVKVKYIR